MATIGPAGAASAGAGRVPANTRAVAAGQGEVVAPDASHADQPAPASARLLIHAVEDDCAGRGMLSRIRPLLRLLMLRELRPNRREPTRMRVDDLDGQPFLACEDVRLPIDMSVPAGTYHVTVRQGKLQRRYTVTLQDGATFDLQLRLADRCQ